MTVSKTTKEKCRNIHILHICLIQFESKMKVAFSSFCAKNVLLTGISLWLDVTQAKVMKLMNSNLECWCLQVNIILCMNLPVW